MRKIEDMEEKKRLLNQTYYNNYILKLEKEDNKYFKKVMETNLILKTDDNYYIIIDIDKPSIDRDLWYDDETERPEKTEELFINYNLRMNSGRIESNVKDNLFIYNPYTQKSEDNFVVVMSDFRSFKIDNGTFVRDLKEDEKVYIQEIYKILLDNYIERLKKYFKRYNDKIYCRGYWVNR